MERGFRVSLAVQGDSAMPDVTANRRNSTRFALILVAVVTDIESKATLSARTSDVSQTGCYVDTLNPIPKGKSVYVTLSRGEETFETKAKVMYVSIGLGMGLKFEEPIDVVQLATLNRWLDKASNLRL
jgi:PilZ domain-containing protein